MKNYKTIKKEVLNYDKKALQVLHGLYGYDFQQEYNLYKHEGKFTINSLVKTYDLDLDNNKVVLLINDIAGFRCNYLHVVEIEEDKTINIDIRTHKSGIYNTKLDNFYVKYDFENIRKLNTTVTYIISQNKKYLNKPHKKEALNYNERYKILDVRGCYNPVKDLHYINNIFLINSKYSQVNDYKYRREYSPDVYSNNIHDIFDKSGYYIELKQLELKRKARQLKTERQKVEFLKGDYKAELLEVDNIVKDIKTKLIELYSNNDLTYNFMSKFNYSFLHDIQWVLHDIEHFKDKIHNKEYGSVDAVNSAYTKISKKYNNIIETLK